MFAFFQYALQTVTKQLQEPILIRSFGTFDASQHARVAVSLVSGVQLKFKKNESPCLG